jgi:hypothetical protein
LCSFEEMSLSGARSITSQIEELPEGSQVLEGRVAAARFGFAAMRKNAGETSPLCERLGVFDPGPPGILCIAFRCVIFAPNVRDVDMRRRQL